MESKRAWCSNGSPPKPTHLKILDGDRADRINYDEPIPDEDCEIKPPPGMRGGARKVWRRLAPDLIDKGVLTAWDVDSFAIVCDALALRAECLKKIHDPGDEDGGLTARGAAGGRIPNPRLRIVRDCYNDIARFGSRFGLTPADRARLTIDRGSDRAPSGAERFFA